MQTQVHYEAQSSDRNNAKNWFMIYVCMAWSFQDCSYKMEIWSILQDTEFLGASLYDAHSGILCRFYQTYETYLCSDNLNWIVWCY